MLKLYYAPRTRAVRPRWLLEELGLPYQLVRVDLAGREHKSEAYRLIHPHGAVPALDDDGILLHESGAICAHLADAHLDKGLAPAPAARERGLYLQWMFYAVATLEPPGFRYFLHTARLAPERRSKSVALEALERFGEAAETLTTALSSGGPFLLGERFSAADVMVGSMLALGRDLGMLAGRPVLEAYVERVTARPAYRRATAD